MGAKVPDTRVQIPLVRIPLDALGEGFFALLIAEVFCIGMKLQENHIVHLHKESESVR